MVLRKNLEKSNYKLISPAISAVSRVLRSGGCMYYENVINAEYLINSADMIKLCVVYLLLLGVDSIPDPTSLGLPSLSTLVNKR